MIRKQIDYFKRLFPRLSRLIFLSRDMLANIPVWFKILRIRKSENRYSIAYLSAKFPEPPALRYEFAYGGAVKLTYLAEIFPHQFPSANLLYAVSSVGHSLQTAIIAEAKRKGLKIIINQNGVAFPAWDGLNYESSNYELKKIINSADFIVYQSLFCKMGAERYISPPNVPYEIVYNPVDTRLFAPEVGPIKSKSLVLLLGGNQFQQYRLELALKTLNALHREMPDAKLIVTGKLWIPDKEAKEWIVCTLRELNLIDHVTFTGTYTQSEAPSLYSRAHFLLHTQYADASPGLVLEALALGMPVIHLGNGGVPELVGDAGIGVHVDHDWERINLPSPQDMADAIIQVYSRRAEYSQRARQRAVELFSLENFIARHKEIFEKVLDS